MKQQDENLSVLLDGEDSARVDSALDAALADVNLQYRMRRYQMIGEVMRNELPQAIDTGFHAEVMARIKDEAATPSLRDNRPAAIGLRNWLKPFAGLAVAASVALVTVALWQPQPEGTTTEVIASADQVKIEKLASQPVTGAAVPVSTQVQTPGMRWTTQDESPVVQQKLNSYLVNHTEYSNSMQGLIPQARVAGFDAQP